MVDLSSILNYRDGVRGASSAVGAKGVSKGAADKPAASGEMTQAMAESEIPDRLAPVKSRLNALTSEMQPQAAGLPLDKTALPDEVEPVGEKARATIADEDYSAAKKRGFVTGQQWLNENARAAREGKRDPLTVGEVVEVLRDGDLNETQDAKQEREKRDKRDKAFRHFGNVAANLANLIFTAKGAVPGDYNNKAATEREREIEARRQKLKERYDEILLNATGDDIKYARSLQEAREKAKVGQERWEKEFERKEGQYLLNKTKHEANEAYRTAMLKENERHHKELEGIAGKNAASGAVRAAVAAGTGTKKNEFKVSTGRGDYVISDPSSASAAAGRLLDAYIKLKTAGLRNGAKKTELEKSLRAKSKGAMLAMTQQAVNEYPQLEDILKDYAEFTPSMSQRPQPQVSAPAPIIATPWNNGGKQTEQLFKPEE